jgi:hypothetical protein
VRAEIRPACETRRTSTAACERHGGGSITNFQPAHTASDRDHLARELVSDDRIGLESGTAAIGHAEIRATDSATADFEHDFIFARDGISARLDAQRQPCAFENRCSHDFPPLANLTNPVFRQVALTLLVGG